MDEPRYETPVELLVLGSCDIRVVEGDARAVVAQPKRFALLVYLVLAHQQGPCQRDELLSLFWPMLTEPRARQALSQSLYFLTTTLGRGLVRRDGRSLVQVGAEVTSDVQRFERFLADENPGEALKEYRGELLPGFHVTGCADFERWLDGERRELRGKAVSAARTLSERCLAEGGQDEAVWYERWAFEQLPYDEDSAVRLFELLSDLGRRGELRREFDAYERRLRDDLHLEPPRYLCDLVPRRDELPPVPASQEKGASDAGATAPRRALGWQLAGAFTLLAVLGILTWAFRGPGGSAEPVPERPRVIVMPFEAVSPDEESTRLARIASDWIARDLVASGLATVVAPRAATARGAADRDADRGDSTMLSLGVSQEAGLAVTGHVRTEAGRIRVDATILELPSRRIVRALPVVQGASFESMDVVEEAGERVAGAIATLLDDRIGSWAEVSSHPPSVEAYRAFFDGLDWFERGEPDSADHYFLEAARQDERFTAPLIWAVRSRVSAHAIEAADSLARALLPERRRLAPWDRAMLDYYVAYLHGTWDEAYQAALRVELLAPDPEWSQLVASSAQAANRPRSALEALERIDRDEQWARDWPLRWRTWTLVYHALGRYEAELAAAAPERGDHPISVGMTEIGAYAGLGRLGAVDSTLARLGDLATDPDLRIRILRRTVEELRAHGHENAASPLASEAVEIVDSLIATGDDSPDRLQLRGELLYLTGRWSEAHAVLSSVEKEDEHGTLLTSRGRAAGRIGRRQEARQAATELLTDDPLDKGHGLFRAATILAALGDEAEATNLLRRAFATGFGFYPWLHTVWEFRSLADYEPFQELVRPRS